MDDKEVKKKLSRVPDVDKNGEPIWKIEVNPEKGGKKKPSKEREKRK